MNHRNCQPAEHLSTQIDTKPRDIPKNLQFISDNQNENFEIRSNQLLCIKAEGNYCNVFYVENEQVVNKLIRTSLKKFENKFQNLSEIKRCHKSFIVNMKNVRRVSGNARNYAFHIEHIPFSVPVSRSFPQQIIKAFWE